MVLGVWWWMEEKVKRLEYNQLMVLDVSGWSSVNVKTGQRLAVKNE